MERVPGRGRKGRTRVGVRVETTSVSEKTRFNFEYGPIFPLPETFGSGHTLRISDGE